MNTRRDFLGRMTVLAAASGRVSGASPEGATGLDPRGRVHVPIGLPNTLDGLKTFVEAEGNFSPGFGSYGIYFWAFDRGAGKLHAPTMDGTACERGLEPAGLPIPFSRWNAGAVDVNTQVCEVQIGDGYVVGARVRLRNPGSNPQKVSLFVALRPLGPAGWAVRKIAVGEGGNVHLVDGGTALVSHSTPAAAGVSSRDDLGGAVSCGDVPPQTNTSSDSGDCSSVQCYPAGVSSRISGPI